MSEDREYYLKVTRSAEHPLGWKRAPMDLVQEALEFEHREAAIRRRIRELEEQLVTLAADAKASPSATVFYDSPGVVYDMRRFVATGDVVYI